MNQKEFNNHKESLNTAISQIESAAPSHQATADLPDYLEELNLNIIIKINEYIDYLNSEIEED